MRAYLRQSIVNGFAERVDGHRGASSCAERAQEQPTVSGSRSWLRSARRRSAFSWKLRTSCMVDDWTFIGCSALP